MSKYHYRLINELRMQLSYSPERRRLEQLDRLSALVGEVRPRRGYRYSAIAQEITRYKPSKCPATKLSGDHLRHDLATLLEDLSLTVNFEAAKCPEVIYSVHQLKDIFDVSPSAIFDWRMEGLPIRYYVMPAGEKTMGVSQSALEVFMGKIVAKAVRSRKFSKVPERKILQRTVRLLSKGKTSLTELAAKLHEEFGLAELAAKCIIREHDRNDPDKAFYSDTYAPLTAGEKAEMFDAHRNGRSVQRLMTQQGRTRQDIYRIVRQVKAERIMAGGLEFVYNKEFDSPKADQVILKIQPDENTRGNVGRRDTHVPAYLTDLCKVPLLGKEEEPELFRRYNYLKYKLYCLWNGLRPSELTQAALEDMRWLRNETSELRNRLLEANLRLVIRMAYKHVGPFANVNELISDGNISLMQAVEKFDYSRGFRFSTYASWALLKNFAKTIPEENYQNEKFVTGQSEMLESVPDPQESLRREEYTMTLRAAINRVMGKLSERERSIVCTRFGIGEDDAQTLGEVGGKMQVTRERVRQIEARALNKMRALLKKESIEADF
jgi:RNA polymerase primary sigma factor